MLLDAGDSSSSILADLLQLLPIEVVVSWFNEQNFSVYLESGNVSFLLVLPLRYYLIVHQ